MKICILAAGEGARLHPYTLEKPKALIEVGKRPLIDFIIKWLYPLNPEEIVVVGGAHSQKVGEYLHTFDRLKFSIRYLINNERTPGNLSSLKIAMTCMDTSFLLCNVDHIYPPELRKIVPNQPNKISIFADHEQNLPADAMKYLSTDNNTFSFMAKDLTKYDGGYIGLSYIGLDYLTKYKTTVDQLYQQKEPSHCAEDVMNLLAKQGESISIIPSNNLRGWEIDTIEDLTEAIRRINY